MIELSKKKYKREDVEKIIEEYDIECQNKISNLTNGIKDLTYENKQLNTELSLYKNNDKAISNAVISAEKMAEEKQNELNDRYELAVQSLKTFLVRWKDYFSALREKYPMYEKVKSADNLTKMLENLIKTGDNATIITELQKEISSNKYNAEKTMFNPKEKIEQYIASNSENGFNLDEVLNPGELQLEDICKELGLIEK